MNKIIFEVPNISCNHCVNTIESEVGEIAGVLSVSASSELKNVEIDFTDPATEDLIRGLLAEINYPAVV